MAFDRHLRDERLLWTRIALNRWREQHSKLVRRGILLRHVTLTCANYCMNIDFRSWQLHTFWSRDLQVRERASRESKKNLLLGVVRRRERRMFDVKLADMRSCFNLWARYAMHDRYFRYIQNCASIKSLTGNRLPLPTRMSFHELPSWIQNFSSLSS